LAEGLKSSRMAQETLSTRELALCILSFELEDGKDLQTLQGAVERTFAKLGAHLTVRLGSAGCRTLVKRAVALAANDLPWLASIEVSESGTLEGFQGMTEAGEVSDGVVAILARLVELLETFIGRTLTERMLHSTWPNAVLAGRPGDTNE